MLILLLLLSANPKPSCGESCNAQRAQCSERCGATAACMDRCERRLRPCTDQCAALEQKAEAKKPSKLPCGQVGGKVVFCSADEEKKLRDLVRTTKVVKLCHDADGEPIDCSAE